MEQKIPLKRLLTTATKFSITIGILVMGIIMITHAYIINVLPTALIIIDILTAVIFTGIVYIVFLIKIWLTSYLAEKYEEDNKIVLIGYVLGILLSTIPIFISVLTLRYFLQFMMQKEFMKPIVELYKPFNHLEPTGWITFFLALFMLFSINSLIHIVLNFILIKERGAKLELENAKLKIKNIEATYQHLKQQVNPHFLFNSLATLNTLIRKYPEKAEIYLKKLSDFLRVSITLNDENSIKLADEIKICTDYLELQKVRFGDALQYNILIPEEAKSGFVPVFTVQILLENAIKHNLLTSESPLYIEVGYDKSWLKIRNNIQVKNSTDESIGMGLVNLAERYKILSGEEIIIESNELHFSVSVKILSHENRNHRG